VVITPRLQRSSLGALSE